MELMATERLVPVADLEARGAGVAAGPPSGRGARYGGHGRTDVLMCIDVAL